MTGRRVSNEEVAAYDPVVASLARRYNGHQGAEYDDLYQEGMVAVFLALRGGFLPSRDIIAKRMRRWVTRCARWTHGGDPLQEDDYALLAE